MISFSLQLRVWAALLVATALQWTLGDGDRDTGSRAVGILILAVAVVKIGAVGGYFMELRRAAPMLRRLFAGYCAVLFAVMVGLYVAAG